MKKYPAIIHKEQNCYWAEFPDLEGCFVQEETFDKLKKAAPVVLSSYLESLDSRKIAIKEPSDITGENIIQVKVDTNIAFAINLKIEREKQGLTQREVAEKAGIAWAVYQRIENPRKSNPTLKTMVKLSEVLGEPVFSF